MNKILLLFCICAAIFTGLSCSENDSEAPPSEQPVTTNQTKDPVTSVAPPVLLAGKIINVGNNPITIGHTASPEIVDWNNDGKKDLILGTYITFPAFPEEGKVMVFKEGAFMSAGGEVINVGAG